MGKKNMSLNKIINTRYPELTAKGKMLAQFVLSSPDKAVFMTTRKLAAAVGVSEATVVRFVRQLNYASYALFIKALRERIDTELTLIERNRLVNSVVGS
jgi:DNA-binding MurR/RpiR family transcriptional regulator